MKKAIVMILAAAALFFGISPLPAMGTEQTEPQSEIIEELDDILSQYDLGFSAGDIGEMSFGDILSLLRDKLSARLAAPLRMLTIIFLVIVMGSVMRSMGESAVSAQSADMYGMVCVMAAVTVIVPPLLDIYGEVLRIVELCGGFISVFVPVMTVVSIGCGRISSAGVYHMMILGASELIVRLSESCLIPVLTVMAALSVTGSVFPGTSMNSLVSFIKKSLTWAISITMTLFTGFVTLKCTITGKADGAAAKTTKMLVSGFVPIVGGAVSDAYSTVKGSFEVIGGTVGAAGIISMALIMLPIILELLIYRIVMWAGAAAADIFTAEAVSRLLKSIDSGLAIAQSILVCYMVMFVVCSAIIMQTLG